MQIPSSAVSIAQIMRRTTNNLASGGHSPTCIERLRKLWFAETWTGSIRIQKYKCGYYKNHAATRHFHKGKIVLEKDETNDKKQEEKNEAEINESSSEKVQAKDPRRFKVKILDGRSKCGGGDQA